MDGYLVILDPMPLFGGEVPFYDGQPRDARKRFTFGKMPDYSLELDSQEWNLDSRKTNERVKNIIGILKDVKLENDGIQRGEVKIYPKGIKHTIGTHRTITLERLMRSQKILADVFRRGDCKEEKIHNDKKEYADRCWHVKAAVKFNHQRTSHIEFVVLHHLGFGHNVLYDATIN